MVLLRAREATMDQFQPIFKANDITEQQWRVIRALQEMGESNAQDLAKASDILSPSLSRIITRLDADKLIKRTVPPEDQRAILIKLSAKGDRLCSKIGAQVEDVYAEIQQRMCPDRLVMLYDLLRELTTLNKQK
jgi:homoprotocatechuate degradation regulator HpaR